ncbi:hypothetical protein GOP47_0002355, partial [Adiantum capillus-veneris]
RPRGKKNRGKSDREGAALVVAASTAPLIAVRGGWRPFLVFEIVFSWRHSSLLAKIISTSWWLRCGLLISLCTVLVMQPLITLGSLQVDVFKGCYIACGCK